MKSFLKSFSTIFLKESRRIFTHEDLRLICFITPIIYCVLFSAVYASRKITQVPIRIESEDNTQLARNFIKRLSAHQLLNTDQETSKDESYANIYIPSDFSALLKKGKQVHIVAAVDSTNFLLANPVMTGVAEAAADFSKDIFLQNMRHASKLPNTKNEILNEPITLDIRPFFNPNLNYSDFFMPGLLFIVIQQVAFAGLAFSISDERQNKKIRGLIKLSNNNIPALLLGKLCPYVILNMITSVFFLLFALPFFHLSLQNWWAGLSLLAIFLFAVCSFGLLISAALKNTKITMIVLMFYSMPVFLMSGYSWPSFAMPWPIKILRLLFPSTYFLSDFRALVLGNIPWTALIPAMLTLSAFALVCFTLTYCLVKKLVQTTQLTDTETA